MGVYEAHGQNLDQISNYNSIYTLDDLSIAEYYHSEKKTIELFEHSHEEYEFMIPIKTIPILVYDKANYIGEVGYAYPVNPFVNHGIGFPLNEAHCLDITVSLSTIEAYKKELGFEGKYFYTRFQLSNSFYSLIKEFQIEFSRCNKDSSLLESLKKLILSYLVEKGLESGEDNRRPEKQYRKSIRSISIYMYEHFSDPNINIEMLAEMSNFSPAYFSKSFKAFMGDTPIVHLNKLRISEAKHLMHENPNMKFLDISAKVGYQQLSTFTEAFKTVTGVTPSEYKELYIKN